MIVLDIDEFKRINDTWGHHVGDHACAKWRTRCRGALRPYDMCVRFAGDEFIVVLSDCSREAARASGASCRSTSPRYRGRGARGQALAARRSAGAAVFPHDGRRTRSCSRRPISGCIGTRPRAAATVAPTPPSMTWIEAAVVGPRPVAGPSRSRDGSVRLGTGGQALGFRAFGTHSRSIPTHVNRFVSQ